MKRTKICEMTQECDRVMGGLIADNEYLSCEIKALRQICHESEWDDECLDKRIKEIVSEEQK